jgi:hypothetical protein
MMRSLGLNGMVWPQYWDQDQRLRRTFNVTAIPTYVLIDGEGVEKLRVKGEGFDSARDLMAEIDKQIKLAALKLCMGGVTAPEGFRIPRRRPSRHSRGDPRARWTPAGRARR